MYEIQSLSTRVANRYGGADSGQEAWREWVTGIHGHFDFDFAAGNSYQGDVVHQHTSAYQLVHWSGEAETLTRTHSSVRRDPRGTYELLVPLHGSLKVEQAGEVGWVRTGEMALVPVDTPLRLSHATDVSSLTLVAPAERIEQRLSRRTGSSHRTLGQVGLPRVVRDLIITLGEQREHLTGSEFDSACDRVVDLFCLAVTGADEQPDRYGDTAVRNSIENYIRSHAADPELTVSTMANTIGWSVRYIQTVLARSGTTATELIRNERLDLARTLLSSRSHAALTISAIANNAGFTSSSAFSYAYRRRFGCSPSDSRRELTKDN